ncbi:TonB-linked outer membrane protein, SusC/RagA family [Catalinimonas alkaloidigena]|uniref:TonB-linked outer membrane protein, SusC/RagA family n=1 Tax=Catalinimonas alkaloidigena TaxID=1075417 RepID=A0A1G9NHI2_9BACT|nr:TonB-dependent receptor [Catalinimonas alkaloidigena]SDL86012.1 TonB-linked outer membrane protein, SusC/RagA family [Catalinimonas alkaloidigena]
MKQFVRQLQRSTCFWLTCCLCTTSLSAQDLALVGGGGEHPAQPSNQVVYIPLQQALEELEQEFKVNISYRQDLIARQKVMRPSAAKGSLEERLERMLAPLNLSYKKVSVNSYAIGNKARSGTQSLRPTHPQSALSPVMRDLQTLQLQLAEQKDVRVTGIIKDASGEGIPGVNVLEKGTTNGTITDVQGRYSLTVGNNATLVLSAVGYMSQEVAVNNRSVIDITMEEDVKALEEIVVVGYGSQEKRDITGAIASVSSREIQELPIANAQQALQGRAAGVEVVTVGNRPGQGVQVRVRGRRSFTAGNDPLYVVDGIPFSGDFGDINSNDIQSMDVLKDASATAIYGSRGSNGVVLVTTRRGKPGKTEVAYSGYYGPSYAYGTVDLMNGEEFAEYKRESRRALVNPKYTAPTGVVDPVQDANLFEAVELANINNGYSWTDYQNLILRTGHRQDHNLSVSGGNDKTTFYLSGSFFNDVGVTKTQDYRRNTVRVNIDHQLNDRFRVGAFTLLGYSVQNWGPNPWGTALRENPLGKPFEDDGSLRFRPTSDGLQTNPLADLVENAYIDENRRYRIFPSLYASAEVTKDLNFRVNFGPDINLRRNGLFQGRYTQARAEGAPLARVLNWNTFAYTFENVLTYQRDFGDIHNLTATGLFSIQQQRDEYSGIEVLDQPYESALFYNLGTAPLINAKASDLSEWGIVSFMGRVQYGLLNRYLLTLTMRADGSSRLAEGNKWGYFPSAALGWRIVDEPFMQSQSVFDELKLRASYGVVGNTNGLRPYITQGALGQTFYAWDNTPAFGFQPNLIRNPNLKWESTATFNVGLDFGLLRNRIFGSFEVYNSNTKDLIMNQQLPTSSGFTQVQRNVGATQVRGMELMVSTVNIDSPGGFKWTTDFNVNVYREKITELYGGQSDDVGSGWFIGYPMTVFFDYEKVGIWQTSEETVAAQYGQRPGEVKVRDQDNNGIIDGNDRVILGTDQPDWTGGMTNRFSYKGFELSAFIFTRQGNLINNTFYTTNNSLAGRYNNVDIDYWTPINPTNAFPRPNQDQESPRYQSTLGYVNGSFVKIRNITLAYNLPSELLKKTGFMSSARIYVSALNPYIFADKSFKNIDPEVTRTPEDNQERTAQVGADTPSIRLYTVGVNIKL